MRLHAISLSNMGCFFMRNSKLHAALRCLDKASAASCKQTSMQLGAETDVITHCGPPAGDAAGSFPLRTHRRCHSRSVSHAPTCVLCEPACVRGVF